MGKHCHHQLSDRPQPNNASAQPSRPTSTTSSLLAKALSRGRESSAPQSAPSSAPSASENPTSTPSRIQPLAHESDAPSGKEISRLEHGRLIELERQLSETLVAKTEQDRRIAQLTDELALKSALLEQAAEEKKRAGLELRELKAKLDESLLSRDYASERTQSAPQKASCAAEAKEQTQRESTEMRAELEARRSESAAFCPRLADTENGYAKSKAEAETYRTHPATSLVNFDEDRVVHRLMERMQAMETELASLRWNEKGFDMMECRNEG
jgi:hypothetical protein